MTGQETDTLSQHRMESKPLSLITMVLVVKNKNKDVNNSKRARDKKKIRIRTVIINTWTRAFCNSFPMSPPKMFSL